MQLEFDEFRVIFSTGLPLNGEHFTICKEGIPGRQQLGLNVGKSRQRPASSVLKGSEFPVTGGIQGNLEDRPPGSRMGFSNQQGVCM